MNVTVISGTEFRPSVVRGVKRFTAIIGQNRILVASATGSFFTGWSWSVDENATGRPIASSVGREYFETPDLAAAACLTSIQTTGG